MIPEQVLTITNGFLRPLRLEDLHQGYIDGLNNPAVNRYLEVRREKQTVESVRSFIKHNVDSNNAVLWGIWRNGSRHHVGTVRIHGINEILRYGDIGICIFCQSAWGQGTGSDAIKAATQWAFAELNLYSIEAHVYLDNAASIRTFLKSGYTRLQDRVKNVSGDSGPIHHAVLRAESEHILEK